MLYFHVTLRDNSRSIDERGIDPALSQSPKTERRSWWVTKSRIAWAIAHVAARRKVSPTELIVYSVYIAENRMRKTRLCGVYTCGGRVRTLRPFKPAVAYLNMEVQS